jgi:opacity protein-like surface antigen
MRSIAALLATVAIASPALAGGPVAVAPEPTVTPVIEPVMAPGMDWTGAYAGIQLGYADVDSNGEGLDGDGMLGGIHGGYRWDMGTFVAGAEVDYDTADIDLGDPALGTLDDVTRLKLIAGTEVGRSLVYGTVGAAHASATVGGTELSDNGWFLGAGVDYAVTDRWSVGGELLKHKFDDFDGQGVDFDATTLKAKVSLRF